MNIGRNDLCWCGSGKKFKYCHMNKNNTQINLYDVSRDHKKMFNKKYCLYPSADKSKCKGQIIKAHTIQRNGGLNQISRNGHVYGFMNDLVTVNKNGGILLPELIGINKASTFTGFCNYHDTMLFKPIETNEFLSNNEHTFLLGYRAICKEYFLKIVQQTSIQYMKDHSPALPNKDLIEFIKVYENGLTSGINLAKSIKKEYDNFLIEKNYSNSNFYVLRIDKVPPIMCSGGSYPDYDFEGNRLQVISDLHKPLDNLTFSIIATDSGGAIVFQWLSNSLKSKDFIKSLNQKDKRNISNLIIKYAFSNFENIYMSPDWWEQLNYKKQKYLIKRINQGVHPFLMRNESTLLKDNIEIVDWEIERIDTNVDFLNSTI